MLTLFDIQLQQYFTFLNDHLRNYWAAPFYTHTVDAILFHTFFNSMP